MADIPPPPPGFSLADSAPPRLTSKAAPPPPGFELADQPAPQRSAAPLRPTGAVHDGDTFRLSDGSSARLLGADAFELAQQGSRGGRPVPIGRDAREMLIRALTPSSIVHDTGERSYDRPVVTVTNGNADLAEGSIADGLAIPVPQYLGSDPARLTRYLDTQREAIADERGAYAGEYQTPADFRHSGEAAPMRGKITMTPDQLSEYSSLVRDPETTPEQLEAWATAQGHVMTNASNILSFARRNPRAGPASYFQQNDALGDAVLPNGPGAVVRTMGALNEGIADVAGFPVDLVNGGLGLVGLPVSDAPVMGSDWIREGMHDLGIGQTSEAYAPRSDIERYGQAFARGTGQAVLPIGGTLSAASRLALRGVAEIGSATSLREALAHGLGRTAAKPAPFIATELAANVGASTGAQIADDVAPGNPLVALGAQLVGGAVGGIGASAAVRPRAIPRLELKPAVAKAADQSLSRAAPVSAEAPAIMDTIAHSSGAARPRPMLASQTEAQIEAAGQRIEPRDVLPLDKHQSEPPAIGEPEISQPALAAHEGWGSTGGPDFAGNIHLDKLDSPQSIARALSVTDQRLGGFDSATRGKITRGETASLASELGMTSADLLARRQGQAFNAEQALAARQILAKSANELVNMAKKVAALDTPGDEAMASFRQAWIRHVAIQEQVAGATAEAGRALAQFRMTADSRAVSGSVLKALADGPQGADRLKEAAELIVENASDPANLNRAAAQAMKPRFRDKLVELYYNSILSGPQTHVVNMMSNTMTALSQFPEHAVAAVVGAPRMASPVSRNDRILFSELGARAVGLLQGSKEGFRQAVHTFRTGEPSDAVSKIESQVGNAISGLKGSIIRTPTRALSAEDELFKAMARRMELSGLAVREARKEGLSGAAAKKRTQELIANPTDVMIAKSFDYGRYLTFQRPLGPIGQSVSRMTQAAPLLKLVLPFVRTPTNILKFSIERSPAAPLLKEVRADFLAGGARRDMAVARVMVGSGAMAATMELVANGHVTGGGPAEDNAKGIQRADGWQPYSFQIGDKYYSYQRLDPFATTLGIAADFADLQSHMTDKQRDQVAGLLVASTLKNLSSKTWLSGVADLSEAVTDPERFGAAYLRQRAASIAVPAVVAQAARTMDPTLHEAKTMLDAIRARVPGLSSALPAKLDVWGKPIENEGGLGPNIVSPVWQSTDKKDPVNAAVLSSGATVSAPGKTLGKRLLADEEYHRYAAAAGQLAHKRLTVLVVGAGFAKRSAPDRAELIEKLVRSARKEVRDQMFGT